MNRYNKCCNKAHNAYMFHKHKLEKHGKENKKTEERKIKIELIYELILHTTHK